MKKMLIVAILLSGCAGKYEYHPVDDEYDVRRIETHVTETTEMDETWVDTALKATLVVGYIAVVAAAALR